jgi:hypothetical protein
MSDAKCPICGGYFDVSYLGQVHMLECLRRNPSRGTVTDQTSGYSPGDVCPQECGGIVTHRVTTGTDKIRYSQCSRCHWHTL